MSTDTAPDLSARHALARRSRRTVVPTRARLRSRRIPVLVYVAGLLLVGGSVVVGGQLLGSWQTSGRTTAAGDKVEATGTDPSEVKGWMSLASVIDAFDVDQAALYERFGIPAGTPTSTALKDLEGIAPGFTVTDLRDWLADQMVP